MIFQPPHIVPAAMTQYAARGIHPAIGIVPSVPAWACPDATSSAAITPIVFWASFAPCPKETAAAEISCNALNGLALSCHLARRRNPATTNMARKATVKASKGEATTATAVFPTASQLIACRPPADSPAPTRGRAGRRVPSTHVGRVPSVQLLEMLIADLRCSRA